MEIWKDVPGYIGLYKVSNYGRVKSVKKQLVLKTCGSGNRYKTVALCNGMRKTFRLHRLVIELIRRTVRPVVKGCYRNAHLLTLLFPDRVQYVEGKTNAFIPIDHAFNRVGDKYIDITFEFALG